MYGFAWKNVFFSKKPTIPHRARLGTVSRPILNESWLNSPSFNAIESGFLRLFITGQSHVTKKSISPPNSWGTKYPLKRSKSIPREFLKTHYPHRIHSRYILKSDNIQDNATWNHRENSRILKKLENSKIS